MISKWGLFENWLLKYMPANPFSKRIIDWSNDASNDIRISSNDGIGPLLLTYITWYTNVDGVSGTPPPLFDLRFN